MSRISNPLNPTLPKDLLVWRCTSNGEFSVKSVYHMEKEMQALRRGGGSRQQDGDVAWKTIWNLKFPNAIKMFM